MNPLIPPEYRPKETLAATIAAYRAGSAAYEALPTEMSDMKGNPYGDLTYSPALGALSEWEKPATTAAEALAALEVAGDEIEFLSVPGEKMFAAVLAYLRAASETPAIKRPAKGGAK